MADTYDNMTGSKRRYMQGYGGKKYNYPQNWERDTNALNNTKYCKKQKMNQESTQKKLMNNPESKSWFPNR